MKNIDWFNVMLIGFCVVVIVGFLGCVLLPIIVRSVIDMWIWALA